MSIEISGPKGYKFQDCACVLLAALAAGNAAIELFIEPEGGEDARLVVMKQGAHHVIEVQAKSEQSDIGLDRLVDWLVHFPNRKTKGSLLENLVSNTSMSVLFVANGRCTDATAAHLVPLDVYRTSAEHGKVKDATESTLRNKLTSYAAMVSSTDSAIDKKRRVHIGSILPKITALELRSASQRVMIVERLVNDDLARKIRDVLQTTHRVISDHAERVVHEIEEIIVREKRTGKNVLPEIAKVIGSGQATDPLRSPTHLDRDEEGSLQAQISKNKVILITGIPRVGKSFLARSLASSLQQKSFRVKVCSGVEEARRYLLEPVNELRAALVDDPLGGSHASENAGRELSQLEQLIPQLGDSRRLIVAQAQDRLLEVTRQPSIQKLNTAGQKWVVLGPGNPEFLNQIWLEAAQLHKVPSYLSEQMSRELLAGRTDLEPGCLVHLASRHHEVAAGAQLDEVVRVARQNANDLGIALRAEGLAPLMTALAVASTPELRVGETELAFILNPSRSDRPGKSDVNTTMISIGANASREVKASGAAEPTYDPIPKLDASAEDGLEELELRRMVSEVHRSYTFNHAFYRASAESLLDAATRRSGEVVISTLERAIFTVEPSAAKAAATNLDWIYKNLCEHDGGSDVVAVAKLGLESIFPAVRELCFSFLLKRLPTLPQNEQGEVSDWVKEVTWPRLSYVVWSNDEPRIPPATVAGALEVTPFPEQVRISEVEGSLELLNSDRADKVLTQAAARATQFLAENPHEMTAQMTARLLSFDVALIRAPAAKAWLCLPRVDDEELLERIFSEYQPSVTQAVYKGVLNAWPDCDEDRRKRLLDGLQRMAASPATAAALVGDLVLISRKEYGDVSTPWRIFEVLMPVVLRELPWGASFSEHRLYDAVDKAMGKISVEALTSIIDHWLGLVSKIADSGDVPSDYMLGISAIVVSGLPIGSVDRFNRIEQLLKLSGTGARIRVVADLVVRWDDLSTEERVKLLGHLVAGAQDEVWVQAAALTRTTVPTDIQAHLLPEGARLDQPARDVIALMDPKLLSASINVLTGNHPIIYCLGVQGFSNTAWKAIVSEIAVMPEHEMFVVVWECLIKYGMVDEMVKALLSLEPFHADRVAELVIDQKRRTNGEFLPEIWSVLFRLPVPKVIKTGWLSRMAKIAPSVLDSFQEAVEWIPNDHFEEFFSLLQPDSNYIRAIHIVRDSTAVYPDQRLPAELVSNLVKLVKALLKSRPPKCCPTYDYLERSFKDMGVEDEGLMTSILDLRSKALEAVHEHLPDRVYPELISWIGKQ